MSDWMEASYDSLLPVATQRGQKVCESEQPEDTCRGAIPKDGSQSSPGGRESLQTTKQRNEGCRGLSIG